MRLRLLAAATAMLASSLAAYADTLFTFTPNGGSSIAFHLEEQEFHQDGVGTGYKTDDGSHLVTFYDDQFGNLQQQYGSGHIDLQFIPLDGAPGGYYFLDGPQLFTGTESAPVFTLGTYNLTSDPDFGVGDATLVIADDPAAVPPLATAATPEPSSLALLGTGLLGLAGVVRRRFA